MRRFTRHHDRAAPLVRYLSGDGRAIAGSLPAWTPSALRHALRPFERPHGAGLLHFTLSLPRGRRLPDEGWHDVAAFVLDRTGLPPDLTPWIAWGREATACDHLHIVAARETFACRRLDPATSRLATDRLERDLADRLGLPDPVWTLEPRTPLLADLRARAVRDPDLRSFGDALNRAVDIYLPADVTALNGAIAGTGGDWVVEPSGLRPGLLEARHLVTGVVINPNDAGRGFGSRALLRRLALAARLRLARAIRALHHLARLVPLEAIPALPPIEEIAYAAPAPVFARGPDLPPGPGHPADPVGPAPRGRSPAPPAPRPAGAAGGRRNGPLRRTADRHAVPDRGLVCRAGAQLPQPRGAPPRPRRTPRDAARRDGLSVGQWLVRILAQTRIRGIGRTTHHIRWDDDIIVLRGEGGARLTCDIREGSVASEGDEVGWRGLGDAVAGLFETDLKASADPDPSDDPAA